MSYKETNANNLQALIDYSQNHPDSKNYISYIAAGRMALLGKEHKKADRDRFDPDDHYKGKITLSITKKKSGTPTGLSFKIDGKLYQGGDESPQTANRSELESEIEVAVQSTTLADLPITYTWR